MGLLGWSLPRVTWPTTFKGCALDVLWNIASLVINGLRLLYGHDWASVVLPSAVSGSSCKAGISQCGHNVTMCPTWLNLLGLKGTYWYISMCMWSFENTLVHAWLWVFVIEITCMCVAVPSSVPRIDPAAAEGIRVELHSWGDPWGRTAAVCLPASLSPSLQRCSNYTGHSTIYYCKHTCTCTQKRSHRCRV